MALNASSHNPMGERTGPTGGAAPSTSSETKAAILEAANKDPLGQHIGGQDAGRAAEKQGDAKVKSEKELERERKKADKLKKLAEKQAKVAAAPPAPIAGGKKEKKEKPEREAAVILPPYIEETPAGHKKIMKSLDDDYLKAYNPEVVESAWYAWWEKEGYFKPEIAPKTQSGSKNGPQEHFYISIPPPNVTGALHIGHALATTLQDIMIRHNRMLGKPTLFAPGCDHAGIATQSVVENMLWRKEKKTRHDFTRQQFIALVQDWKNEYHKKICNTLRKLGASVDWDRERFTMDEAYQAAVGETFVRLHEEGLIFRANRLVNWCPQLNTALSNIEVDNKELEGRTMLDVPGYNKKVEFGVLIHFKYPIENSSETIEVATTRVETMLGDTAIAVNPKDERFKHLVGKFAIHPFIKRKLPIVADTYVEMEFGTGAVKITPAHDTNDNELGKRHNLEVVNVFTDDGMMNDLCGEFTGIHRFQARGDVVTKLQDKGLYVKTENNPMKVPMCSRSKDVIEPMIKPQWYMDVEDMSKEAVKIVESGELKIKPESAEKSYMRWMQNVQPWCLSRQLWWGHQIPAYFVSLDGEENSETSLAEKDDLEGAAGTQRKSDARWIVALDEKAAMEIAEKRFPGKKVSLRRDDDVLDTWFSSGLWPFAILGWPKNTEDVRKFYPSSMLETGWDILFFWVAKMVFLGTKLTGKSPFTEVFCHALVRDSEGRKMSKSLGNVIDPIDVMKGIELEALHDKLLQGNLDPKELGKASKFQKTAFPDGIPECGADAIRFGLAAYSTGGSDINMDIKVIHAYRKFCNKIYQATKYVLGKLGADYIPPATATKTGNESLAEQWILRKLAIASKDINQSLHDRNFSDAASSCYQFWYMQLCDIFIENSKSLIQNGTPAEQSSAKSTLYTAIDSGLRLLHPFMPFLSEELWQRLPRRPHDPTPSIVIASYPLYTDYSTHDNPSAESAYDLILAISRAIRSLTSAYTIKHSATIYTQITSPDLLSIATSQQKSILSLSGKSISHLNLLSSADPKPKGCMPFVVDSNVTVFLLVVGHIDVDAEIAKASRKLDKAAAAVEKQRKMLADEAWKANVPEEVKRVERKKLVDAEGEVREMEGSVEQFMVLKLGL